MILAISDIHSCYDLFMEKLKLIEAELEDANNKLILLGDYIDRGPDSFRCLEKAYSLQQKYGKEQVIVLRGNHEEWFIDFLKGEGDEWLAEDRNYHTSKTFLTDAQYLELLSISSHQRRIEFIIRVIKENHKELLRWMVNLPYFYETETQIFVHAGVDEEIPEEEMEYCTLCTAEYIFTGKVPPTVGRFYKTIIAGHIAAASVAHDAGWPGIYFDKQSHYYIDGGAPKRKRLLCLVYDETSQTYYELMSDGRKKKL